MTDASSRLQVQRKELATTLRQLRTAAGMTLDQAAEALEVSAPTVSRYETGVRVPRARDVRDLCRFYGVTDEARIARLSGLVSAAREPGWWESYSEVDDENFAALIGWEAAASHRQQYETRYVPGILQTADYARACLTAGANPSRDSSSHALDIEKLVEVRLRRQEVIREASTQSHAFVLDQAAIDRRIGGDDVMRAQMRQLVELAQTDIVTIRVLPFAVGAHPGLDGPFTIFKIPSDVVSDIVYVDTMAGIFIRDEAGEVEKYRAVFRELEILALPADQSLDLLRAIANNRQ